MKVILLSLFLLTAIVAGAIYFIDPAKKETKSDADMLQLGNFAFQQQRYDDAYKWYVKAALEGKAQAQFKLSQMLLLGQGVDKNTQLSLRWLKKAALNKLAKAEYEYANALFFGKGIEQPNPDEALLWYEKAAKQNHPEAKLKVAKIYFEQSDKTAEKLYEALEWVIQAYTHPLTKTKASPLQKKIIDTIKAKARRNDSTAQFKLAEMYQHGKGLDENVQKAEYWLHQSAKYGNAEAQFHLGKALAEQVSTKEAIRWLTKAAKKGHIEAGYAIAVLLGQESRPFGNLNEAWRWLYHGLRDANPKVLYNLAVILHQGNLGLAQNDSYFEAWLSMAAKQKITPAQNDISVYYILNNKRKKESLVWLEDAAQAGDTSAQFNLGFLFARGDIFTPNDEKALHWWKLAEQNGNTKAQLMLGLFYHIGRGTGRSEQEAIMWYEKAGASGSKDALYNLAMIYYHGRGVDQDFNKAAQYLDDLAHKEDAQAQNLLATLYLEGKGVPFSLESAVSWFKRSAKGGNVNAMFNLATAYRSGKGIRQNDEKAMYWYTKAAANNFAPAQNAIGYLYAEGRGVKKDLDKAEEWFYKSRENGLRIAGKNLETLRHRGNFSLVTLQINEAIRSQVLTDKKIDLSQWLEIHNQPIL